MQYSLLIIISRKSSLQDSCKDGFQYHNIVETTVAYSGVAIVYYTPQV